MKIIYILQCTKSDYEWNGEESILVDNSYPAIAFELKDDAEQFKKNNEDYQFEQIWEVNCYEPNDKIF